MKARKLWWWLLPLALALVLLFCAAGFVVWANTGPKAMPEALDAMRSDSEVQVDTEPWLVFRPVDAEPRTGFIFYPGGRVDPRAYAPAARELAAAGHPVAIVPMPLNLAFFAPDRAAEVMAAFPEIDRWAIGGHSLGGAMAARFAYQNPDAVQGLALWASYPATSDDLSGRDLAVTSIYGTLDGLATEDEIAASRALLPPDARWAPIEGGNHAQFGWYGPQDGDNQAAISQTAQQDQIVAATLALLKGLDKPAP
jgi:pimeloyl-ACP methyl ester carboxylesterase